MKKEILVIDNSRLERAYIKELFNGTDYTPVFSESFFEGLELLPERDFSLIFLNRTDIFGKLQEAIKKLSEPLRKNATVIIMEDELFTPEDVYPLTVKKPLTKEKLKAMLELFVPEDTGDQRLSNDPMNKVDKKVEPYDGIEGLDYAEGVKNCGSLEGYHEALAVFYNTIEGKAGEIDKLYHDSDIKNYIIKVHALKSAARLVGALELSEKARLLEEAGNEENIEYIDNNTDELLVCLKSFSKKLKPILEKDEADDARPLIDESELSETFSAIAEYADAMDYDSIEMLLGYLADYRLPAKDKDRYDRLNTLLLEMKWEEIVELCRI
ncbi:MAG: response regulator [Lachnospiraceae bacterium]|nr:response regulator [Lachnospiraceae bacterium]